MNALRRKDSYKLFFGEIRMKLLAIAVIVVAVISLAMAVYEPAVEPNQAVNKLNSLDSAIPETDLKVVIRQLNRKIIDLEKQVSRLQVQVRDNANSIQDLALRVDLLKKQPEIVYRDVPYREPSRRRSVTNTLPKESEK